MPSRLNETLDGRVLIKACELDIPDSGRRDLPDSILARPGLKVCAVHYKFALSRELQTERILRAMDNPNLNVLAHPTGRLINQRPPDEVDLERLIRAARDKGRFMELDAHPGRLDPTNEACLMAREIGLKVAISDDAHSTSSLDFTRFGMDQARRGWLSAEDVLGTRSLRALRRLLRR
jgi:DNA polymerase (family 10)